MCYTNKFVSNAKLLKHRKNRLLPSAIWKVSEQLVFLEYFDDVEHFPFFVLIG